MAFTIVPAGPQDIDAIQGIAAAVWPVAYRDILSSAQLAYMLDLFYSREALQEQMLGRGHQFLLAKGLVEQVVGFASFSVDRQRTAHVHKLYVLPQTQGGGAGKDLLKHCEDAARESEAVTMQLNVNRHNRAKSFYGHHGYCVILEEDIAIGNGYFMNDYRMEKSLHS